MKRVLPLSVLLALAVACDPAPTPSSVPDRTVSVGQQLSAPVTQEFNGTWTVTGVPSWLAVSTVAGSGPVNFTVTATRVNVTPLKADQPQLTGTIKVNWASPDGKTSGIATWTVVVDQFRLTGRVVDSAQLSAQDITSGVSTAAGGGSEESRGIIVQYRSAGVRDGVLTSTSDLPSNLQGQGAALSSRAKLDSLGIAARQRRPLGERALTLKVPATTSTLAALRADPNVESAVPNRVLHAQALQSQPLQGQSLQGQSLVSPVVPSDQYAPLQWAFKLMGYPAVWRDMEAGGYTRPVTVAVLDSGVRYDHPDLDGKLLTSSQGALDFTDGDFDPTDTGPPDATGHRESHGTHVAGIIVANWGANTLPTCATCSPTGVVGATYLAPVRVLPVRVLGAGGTDVATVASAVQYAAGIPTAFTKADGSSVTLTNPNPAQVINLSLGGPISVQEAAPLCSAIAQAKTRGTLTFAAAGNEYSSTPDYPAACDAAVSVGSVTLSGASAPVHADYSNTYPKVELSAPGGVGFANTTFNGGVLNGSAYPDTILSTGWDYATNTPNYISMSGTSQATPQASAVAALLLSKGVTSGPDDTLNRLKATATDLGPAGRDDAFGVGMINAAAALNAPAISDTLGLRVQDSRGNSYQPALDTLGNFTAYLADGTYSVVAGRDRDGNGIYGEVNEPRAERSVTLDPAQPNVNLGDLTPQ